MKVTLNDTVSIYSTLSTLFKTNIAFNISYWIMKNLNIFEENYNYFIHERDKLYQEYLVLNNQQSYITQIDDTHAQFNFKENIEVQDFVDKFNELLGMECEIQPYLIKLSVLMDSGIEITPEQLVAIECLIDETE